MAEAAAASPGALTLIATGPMTNVALACLVDPSFPTHVGTLHAMGGAEGKGNITPYAEWNFHCDPESAQVVSPVIAWARLYLDVDVPISMWAPCMPLESREGWQPHPIC